LLTHHKIQKTSWGSNAKREREQAKPQLPKRPQMWQQRNRREE
jgi:hypothetical protein